MKDNKLQIRPEPNLPSEFNALKENKSMNEILVIMPEHKQMLEVIKSSLPEVQRATAAVGGKTQSQFMDNMMTVSNNTPGRNLRQILAQMVQTRQAIKEANYNLQKKELEAAVKREEAEASASPAKKALLIKEAEQLEEASEDTKIYLSGAVRTLANYTVQYNNIMTKFPHMKDWAEADFEKDEERHHIMKAFEQALCAARSHGGVIDEGNHIYLAQIGINGGHAQFEITQFLSVERQMLEGHPGDPAKGIAPRAPIAPTHEMYIAFLNNMADHFLGSAEAYAASKGMKTSTDLAMIQEGDTRLSDPRISAKVLTRLKKLSALSKSPNENEAKRASEKLAKFLEKNGLTMDQVKKHLL